MLRHCEERSDEAIYKKIKSILKKRARGLGDLKGDKGSASQVGPLVPLMKNQESNFHRKVCFEIDSTL